MVFFAASYLGGLLSCSDCTGMGSTETYHTGLGIFMMKSEGEYITDVSEEVIVGSKFVFWD